RPEPGVDPSAVVGKALVRAAAALDLSQLDVARILGSSTASVSRTFAGGRGVDPDSAEGRNALLLIRVFRSLDPLVGGDTAKARLWLHAKNRHLGDVPARLLTSMQGLVHVADYLDAMRGRL